MYKYWFCMKLKYVNNLYISLHTKDSAFIKNHKLVHIKLNKQQLFIIILIKFRNFINNITKTPYYFLKLIKLTEY